MKKIIVLGFIPAFMFNCACGEEYEAPDDFFDLDLNELAQIKVTVASKTEESISEAPSSVTVFTRRQIRMLGVENIYALLNYVPGFQATRAVDLAREQLLHVRGIANIDGHVLILLNGHRLNEASFGRATLYNRYLSTHNVKQVEVIRGPGSALYGSNAFLGVVNIITDDESNEAGLQTGSEEEISGFVNAHRRFNEQFSAGVSLSYVEDQGQAYRLPGAPSTEDPYENLNLYSTLSYRDFKVNLGYMKYVDEDFITFNAVAPQGDTESKTEYFVADLNHYWQINERFKLNSSLSFTRHQIEFTGLLRPARPPQQENPLYSGPYSQSTDWEINVDSSYQLNDHSELLAGFSYRHEGVDYLGAYTNHLTPDGYQIAPRNQFYLGEVRRIKDIGQLDSRERYLDIYGPYIQYKTVFNEHLTGFAGLRYDYYSVVGGSLNPRAGLIYKADAHSSFKLLYGSAFRAPTNQELFTNSPRSVGNEDLQPEEIQTIEWVYQHQSARGTFEASLFHNQLSDIIDVEIGGAEGGRNTWSNQGDSSFTGLELGLHYKLTPAVGVRLTHTHLFSELAPNTYKDFSSFGFNFSHHAWNLNLNGIYRIQPDDTLADQGDYVITNAKLSYQINSALQVYTLARNVFDSDYQTYEEKLSSQNFAVPNRGRELKIGLVWSWD